MLSNQATEVWNWNFQNRLRAIIGSEQDMNIPSSFSQTLAFLKNISE